MDPSRAPSREGVLRAAEKIAALLPPTPLLPLEVDGRTIWCKAEMLQPIGAFKIRGAWHRLTDLDEAQRARGVVGVSSGNHAQGVAWSARRLGIAATIVMPTNAPRAKLESTRALGAEIVLYDRATQDRDGIAAELVAQTGGTLVHAYGDPWVIEGQGTAALEAARQLEQRIGRGPDRIVVCCGGGGLTAGVALACPDAEIFIAEPEGWDDVLNSLAAGEIVGVKDLTHPTDCDALQTPRTFPINFEILKRRVSGGAAVTPAEVGAAIRLAFEKLHLVVEPGGAAALAAIVSGKVAATDATIVTLSGGNVDRETFLRLIG
ncbi:threonine/serine dehydratase [Sphingobium sp. H33]|uniref:Threonine/serine dehydratase n=1 Tax=Sphingobium nicotianae TaxID=2782607 RepID=A0A9X1DD16_9SPHN|nr:threonine/serine dehydratase [Sphingobium nicotianae]MBT2187687.1 threonine/serine dehydratase [Sphingobium nicotianae]